MLLPSLESVWREHLQRFLDNAPAEADWLQGELNADPDFRAQLQRVWSCSDFVADACTTNPAMFKALVESGDLYARYSEHDMAARLAASLDGVRTDSELMRPLRLFRQREMVRIIWRDFSRRADMQETTRDMSLLAETVIRQALDILHHQACAEWGTPVNAAGEPQQLVVLGMGKLGAWELNVSSDIDLIFAYPEKGETQGGRRQLSNQEFFIKLAQRLIRVIDERTADGFVFRVDMRLRPYGQSGALVLNFDAMEAYYQNQGRDWERYAMIKARVIAGDPVAGQNLIMLLRPFTYRKYLDYSAIQALREMKALINREVKRAGNADDIKKGPGGIREVEFIAQVFQIVRGGRDTRLQRQPLREILPLLEQEQLLPPGTAEQLYEAYTLLRNLEHGLQGWRDQQTQKLPTDPEGRLRLAYLMGFADWDALATELRRQRALIHQVFAGIIADSEEQQSADAKEAGLTPLLTAVWQGLIPVPEAEQGLTNIGCVPAAEALASLEKLRVSRQVVAMSASARQRLDNFMPLLLEACVEAEAPVRTLQRILPLVESVIRRSAYLLMLTENPPALERLVTLCDGSPWIADELSRHPALLDELLDARTLFALPDKHELRSELQQQLLRIPKDDLEAQMDSLRYFRRSHGLRVAACEITGALPLMQVSDYLTWLAEAILEEVTAMAWEQMAERYGEPGSQGQEIPGLVIIGYGKLGGIELSHGSDLDLVFLHNADARLWTTGARAVDNSTFFIRLGQRIIHILTAQTAAGKLYEVDIRLRPSGNSGLLVTSLASFAKYQREDAWTWEHQALVRARAVAGHRLLAEQFDQIRREILSRRRPLPELRNDVCEMRRKMNRHLAGKSDGFDLKQDIGGIVDIEFMVQFAVLAWAHDFPELTRWSDNIRILESLGEAGLFSIEEVQVLTEAYKKYRATGHRLQLQQQSSVITDQQFDSLRQEITKLWLYYLGEY